MREKRFVIPADIGESVPLPPAKGLHFKQWKLVGGAPPTEALILDQQIYSRLIHYWSRRTFPCLRPEAPCPICEAGGTKTIRWEGYASIIAKGAKGVFWLRITPGLAHDLPELTDRGSDLRGARLKVWREGKDDRGQVKGSITVGYRPQIQLPNAIDLPRFMRQQWEADNLPPDEPKYDPSRRPTF